MTRQGWQFWKRRPSDFPQAKDDEHTHPPIEMQADRLVHESMEGIGKSLRRAAEIRQALAEGALELRVGKK